LFRKLSVEKAVEEVKLSLVLCWNPTLQVPAGEECQWSGIKPENRQNKIENNGVISTGFSNLWETAKYH